MRFRAHEWALFRARINLRYAQANLGVARRHGCELAVSVAEQHVKERLNILWGAQIAFERAYANLRPPAIAAFN